MEPITLTPAELARNILEGPHSGERSSLTILAEEVLKQRDRIAELETLVEDLNEELDELYLDDLDMDDLDEDDVEWLDECDCPDCCEDDD